MNARRGVAILGSTGSVGSNALEVLRRLEGTHRVLALAAGRNAAALMEQIREFQPVLASLDQPDAAAEIRESAGRLGTRVVCGAEGSRAVATCDGVDLVVSAIVGAAGVVPSHAAVVSGRSVALANKEVMVVAGDVVRRAAEASGATLLPVDSEHNALHQALRAGRPEEVKRLILTASGGPFWKRDGATFDRITVQEALDHPVWSMGPKISVDSATMMNKGLEVIEACRLYDMDPGRVDILVHPESVVHSLVEFVDGSIMAQMGVADMRGPLQYALTWPERQVNPVAPLDLANVSSLHFQELDPQRFPCPRLAYRALDIAGVAPAALNGGNEAVVASFLEGDLAFTEIPLRLADVLDRVQRGEAPGSSLARPDLDACLAADAWARDVALAPRATLPAPLSEGLVS
ncbi:MAG: 1-deoxy-D-xylulose-5-phosphate reductoisomerase [Acidobacteriota bacterium]